MPNFHLDRRARDLLPKVTAGDPDELLTTEGLAELLGVSPQFIKARTTEGNGPESHLFKPRSRRYRRGDAAAWLKERAAIFEKERADAEI